MESSNGKVGAVLVVGGGVAGMQAALDLVESGFKAYLMDKQPCIGGAMAQLDKTFPTNDCSMCIVSPRLVDVGRHLNIDIITDSEIESIQGEPGNFTVTLKKHARYVDVSKCTGCGECATVCPIERPDEFNMGMNTRKAIYRRYPQAVPNAFGVEKTGQSPCSLACPVEVNAHGYVALVAQRRFKEALEVERKNNPFPGICGRICPHPCELDCRRGTVDQPVSIALLKRFLADWEVQSGEKPEPPKVEKRPEKVAVIGGGPAGITCAHDLALLGYQITVFEAKSVAGGMLRTAIPEFRLPREVIDKEVQNVRDLGVEIKLNAPVGPKLTMKDLKEQGYKAFFVAVGASKGRPISLPGTRGLDGLTDAITFLQNIRLGGEFKPVNRVVVAGGGYPALDAARTALRLGCKEATILYRNRDVEYPCDARVIREALEEGVKIECLTVPQEIEGKDGHVTGVKCVRMMKSGTPDATGRWRSAPIKDSEFTVPADLVIAALWQDPDLSHFTKTEGLRTTSWNFLVVDGDTMETDVPGVFAGGDVVSGPASVIDAIASGKHAAVSIDRYLNGLDLKPEQTPREVTKVIKDIAGVRKQSRPAMPARPVAERVRDFKEVELGYSEGDAVTEAMRCLDCSICCECELCAAACQAGAIDHDMPREKAVELNVGAVILAPGFDLFNPDVKKELGYDRYPNVISSLEFERILSTTGPTTGHIKRPSDGTHPKKVAFIQCVGSRECDANYCSSVCCMYATKEAIIAQEHEPGLEVTIFFIDLRAFSKGFEEYYERAKKQGIRYIRCRPSSIKEAPDTKSLRIIYQGEDGALTREEFDMVVLSSGLRPPADLTALGEKLSFRVNEFGFCETMAYAPVDTSRPGVYVCGPFAEPKDIPETVIQASGAAARAGELLASARGTMLKKRTYPPETDVTGLEPRIGVFICHCGINIAGVVDVKGVAEYARTLPNVVYADNYLYTCSNDAQERIRELIAEHNLNRVVVAACSPRTHEPIFRSTIRQAGLNEYLFEMTNIRDQCSWVHMGEKEPALRKSKDLVRMAVAKVRMHEPLQRKSLQVNHEALVIGGGVAGMTAALNLANSGYLTHLVERSARLGGNFNSLRYSLNGEEPEKFINNLIQQVSANNNIRLYTETEVGNIEGFFGNFTSRLKMGGAEKEIKHGVVIVATGAKEYKPTEYLYGQDPRVMTQLELEEQIGAGRLQNPGTVVMIQCVGSRDEAHPYCSRICCIHSVKNALRIKALSPQTQVYVLYRDIRTYGFNEKYYGKAREAGVIFIRYEKEEPPAVIKDGETLKVTVKDQMLGSDLTLTPDLLVLSAGVVPPEDNKALAQQLKVPLTQDGFFLEAHMKLRPVDFASDGIYLCGLAHFPKTAEESIGQAQAAAARAATILSKDSIELEAAISEVVDEYCDGCAYCVDPCPYKALTLIEYMRGGAIKKTVQNDDTACKGCGVCMATCPKKGIYVKHFKTEQLAAMVNALLTG